MQKVTLKSKVSLGCDYRIYNKDFSIESVFFSELLQLLQNHSKSPEKKTPSIEKSLIYKIQEVYNVQFVCFSLLVLADPDVADRFCNFQKAIILSCWDLMLSPRNILLISSTLEMLQRGLECKVSPRKQPNYTVKFSFKVQFFLKVSYFVKRSK